MIQQLSRVVKTPSYLSSVISFNLFANRCSRYVCFNQQKVSLLRTSSNKYFTSSSENVHHSDSSYYKRDNKKKTNFYKVSYISLFAAFSYFVYKQRSILYAKELLSTDDTKATLENGSSKSTVPGLEIAGLPIFSAKEVARHDDVNDPEKGVWISYKAGVYDVTSFVKVHPGGDNILLGAGNSVEPFWEVYGQHKTQQVFELLESFRIGNLQNEDRLKASDIVSAESVEYIPEGRNSELTIHHEKPFNAETPPELLMKSWLTSNENFFIRHHLAVPEVNPDEYELEVEGLTLDKSCILSLDQIKNIFPKHTVTSVIQCAGNRRDALNEIKEVKGISWGVGAIGNAQWSGAKLVDVLQYCGCNLTDASIQHVQFEGLDLDATATPYGASVPADKALNPQNEFLLAYEMNGRPIPPDHGFPVRLVAPGIVGARNVKWLGRIVLSTEESTSHWQRNDYKSFPPSVESASAEQFSAAFAIQELPIQSAICTPTSGTTMPIRWRQSEDDSGQLLLLPFIEVAGYAWSGGGRAVIRVDLSLDGGQSWHVAELSKEDQPPRPPHHTYSWTTWKVDLPLKPGSSLHQGKEYEIICRATDSSYNTQPRDARDIWNFRGLLNNSWHRVKVRL